MGMRSTQIPAQRVHIALALVRFAAWAANARPGLTEWVQWHDEAWNLVSRSNDADDTVVARRPKKAAAGQMLRV